MSATKVAAKMTLNKYKNIIRQVILLLLFFSVSDYTFGQNSPKQYVIITFEDQYKISQHGKKHYHWIVSVDSIKSTAINLSRLILNGYSKQVLESSCVGQKVDPYGVTTSSTYDFKSTYLEQVSLLEDIVEKNKRKIQQVSKRWESGQKETLRIYATPVNGFFCSTKLNEYAVLTSAYMGNVYFPYSDFLLNQDFWKTEKAKGLLNHDYSAIKFDIFQ